MKKIEVKDSHIEGKGIFALEDVRKGEKIQYIAGTKVKKLAKTKQEALSIPTWFGLSRHYWMDPGDSPFRFLNHSCDSNAGIMGTKTLVAITDIKKGEEITIDYSMTDVDPLWEMPCVCGSKNCRKIIRSIQTVPPEDFKRQMPYIPRYFQRVYIRNHVKTNEVKFTYGSAAHS